MSDQCIGVQVSESAQTWLAEQGYDPVFGARPLRRTLQRLVENELSKMIMRGEIHAGDHLQIDIEGAALVFHKLSSTQPATVSA
jgi:ATP-dependent Clp protease ATP-binding subunit ClpC